MKFLLLTVALMHCAFAAQDALPIGIDLCEKCAAGMIADGDKYKSELCEPCAKILADADLGGLDDDSDDKLVLIACDEVEDGEQPPKFEISRKAALMCGLVKNILEGDKTADDIEIKKVDASTLEHVVEYLEHRHKELKKTGKLPAEIQKPIRSTEMRKIVGDSWDADFINKHTKAVIFEIILGANYMDIKSLLHLGCAKIATLIKGKSPEEIKQILSTDDEVHDSQDDGDVNEDDKAVENLVRPFGTGSSL